MPHQTIWNVNLISLTSAISIVVWKKFTAHAAVVGWRCAAGGPFFHVGCASLGHSTLSDIAGLASDDDIADFFVVTLVRNPWDRMVSYYHWLRGQGFDHPAVKLAQSLDFSGFLNADETRATIAAHPYGRYVTTRAGQERCDLFIRLEHFAEDVKPFEAHLGFALAPLAAANLSARDRDWRGYYSDADADLVGLVCGADIARFGYRFDSTGEIAKNPPFV